MIETILASCSRCGDEVIYTVARLVERDEIEYFVYEDAAGHCIERRITSPEIRPLPIYDVVLFETIGAQA